MDPLVFNVSEQRRNCCEVDGDHGEERCDSAEDREPWPVGKHSAKNCKTQGQVDGSYTGKGDRGIDDKRS